MVRLLPTFGILLFVGLYLFSSTLYPGGSQMDAHSEGFSWMHNYWCNLLYVEAINGQANPARPYAMVGMGVLCASLALFFYWFPKYFSVNRIWNAVIRIGGVGGMITTCLISTNLHDLMTTVSSIFGLAALVGVFYGVLKYKLRVFAITAAVCILLLGINNYIYYTFNYIELLPVVQKITFVMVLSWVGALNFKFQRLRN